MLITFRMFIGKFIAASQRPDGTWRKARRVKDGYVPQEEVPLYESKGKLFAKKPALPVGMCPHVAAASRKAHSANHNHTPIPGLVIVKRNKPPKVKKEPTTASEKKLTKAAAAAGESVINSKQQSNNSNENSLSHMLDRLSIGDGSGGGAMDDDSSDADKLAKMLKKLRRKIREIENIEGKIQSGDIKQPDKDQLGKISRKKQMLHEIKQLESHPLLVANLT